MAKTVRIEGLREIEKALAELPKATARNTLRRVLKARGQPIADKAKSLAPDRPGKPINDLVESISVSPKLNKNQKREARRAKDPKMFAEMFVGPRTDIPFPHGHFQEFGTANHGPQPFMRPAWDATKDGVLSGITDDLWSAIQKAAERQAKKRAKAAKG